MVQFLKFLSQEHFLNRMNNDEDGARTRVTSDDADRAIDDLLAEIDTANNPRPARSPYGRTPTPADPAQRPLPPTLDDRAQTAEANYNRLESAYMAHLQNYNQNPNKDPQELNALRAEYIAKAEAEKIYFGLKAEQEPANANEHQNRIDNVQANIDSTRQAMLSAMQAELPADRGPVTYETLPAQPQTENIYGNLSLIPDPNDSITTETQQAEPRTLSEKENKEISEAIDKARGKTALTDPTLSDGERTLKESIAKLSEDQYKILKIQNTDFLKEAAQAALQGGSEVTNFLNKEVGKFNFVQDINKAVEHDGKKLEQNQFKEVANAHERFSANKIDSGKVVDFVKKYQEINLDIKGKKQEFPLKLITDAKNEGMVKLVARDPETAAIGLQAFKEREGKGLNAFKAVDLGKGMEAAMLSAAKQIEPEQKKLAVSNIVNMVMNTAVGGRYELISGKVKIDQDKLDAISKGVKQDKLQEKPTKSFGDVFRDKTGLGGTAGDKGKVVGPFGGLVRKSPVNLHPGDNAKATWETIKGLKTANPFKAAYNLVKLAAYNIPKLAVSALIATPIALIRTATQMSKDKKNLRLQNVATLATKYPKVYKAIAHALQKDGKGKVHNKDILKAFSGLGDKAQTIENSTLSVKAIKDALSQKAGHANHMSDETKKNYVKKTDGKFNEPKVIEVANKKLDVGKGPTVIENIMRGGSSLGILEEAAKASQKKLELPDKPKGHEAIPTMEEMQRIAAKPMPTSQHAKESNTGVPTPPPMPAPTQGVGSGSYTNSRKNEQTTGAQAIDAAKAIGIANPEAAKDALKLIEKIATGNNQPTTVTPAPRSAENIAARKQGGVQV